MSKRGGRGKLKQALATAARDARSYVATGTTALLLGALFAWLPPDSHHHHRHDVGTDLFELAVMCVYAVGGPKGVMAVAGAIALACYALALIVWAHARRKTHGA